MKPWQQQKLMIWKEKSSALARVDESLQYASTVNSPDSGVKQQVTMPPKHLQTTTLALLAGNIIKNLQELILMYSNIF